MLEKLNYEQLKKDLLGAGICIGVFLLYYTSQYFIDIPFAIFGRSVNDLNYTLRTIYVIFYQLCILGIIMLIFKDKIKHDFIDFKKNKNKYLNSYFKLWFLILVLTMASNAIIMLINNGEVANNEEAINSIFDKNPIYVYLAATFIAPITEELVFRLGLRRWFRTDILFIILSGLLFGLAHTVGQINVLTDYLYIIPYSIPGFVFGYLLTKTDNIFVPISMHMFHNGILMGLQIFALLFS